MSGHTPGPWEVWRGDVWTDNDYLIANINTAQEVGRGKANARLIAAAPELLAALIECVIDMQATEDHYGEHPRAQEVMAQARAAIAKATGENV